MASITSERRDKILSLAYRNNHVSLKELVDELGVSEATVRRDLQSISAEGLLELKGGVASVIKNSDYSFISKSMRNIEAKKTIAALACDFIKNGDQVFLDSGTTCFEVAKLLRGKHSVSVIVNSVRTAQELQAPGLNVLMLGGQYRPDRMDCVGAVAFQTLDRFRGYTAFVGTDGLSMDFGFTSIDIESANIFGLAVKNAKQVILLADSSKFDKPTLYKTTDINNISIVITEKCPSSEWCKFFENNGIQLIYPSEGRKSN
ncbi:MAG: DeoR/GlpR family DNA-binding transcription regulator [Phycisphaerales bacterium]